MFHLIIFKPYISRDDAATKDRYHLSLGTTSPCNIYTYLRSDPYGHINNFGALDFKITDRGPVKF
jgi:hypothetical protein